jgi:adenosylmethionine-8-amino-7-oxononanoate aminotransferase
MAGLWCVNTGYGRTELADVAAAQMRVLPYYPHTAINAPAAALAERVNGLLGGDNHVYFVASGSEANEAGFKFVGAPSENRQVFQISTYGGHPVATAVARRNIEIFLEEQLPERAAENGAYLFDGLCTLTKHPWVGDVRGKGLLAGIELVKDRRTKEVVSADCIKGIVDFARRNGVIVGRSGSGRHLGNTIVLSPPLVITRSEIDRIVAVLDHAIEAAGKTFEAS